MMHSETETALDSRKYSINITVEDSDVSLDFTVEKGITPYWIEIQQALLLMCLKIGSQLDEELN